MSKWFLRCFGAVLVFFAVSCLWAGAAPKSGYDRLAGLKRSIDEQIGTPRANEPAQCKLIAFGSKPCGGPSSYRAYSTAQTNESKLKELVTEFNELQKKVNEERGLVSDCVFVTEPKVELAGGVCTIRSP